MRSSTSSNYSRLVESAQTASHERHDRSASLGLGDALRRNLFTLTLLTGCAALDRKSCTLANSSSPERGRDWWLRWPPATPSNEHRGASYQWQLCRWQPISSAATEWNCVPALLQVETVTLIVSRTLRDLKTAILAAATRTATFSHREPFLANAFGDEEVSVNRACLIGWSLRRDVLDAITVRSRCRCNSRNVGHRQYPICLVQPSLRPASGFCGVAMYATQRRRQKITVLVG